jgi:hypothetical protein
VLPVAHAISFKSSRMHACCLGPQAGRTAQQRQMPSGSRGQPHA